MLDPAVTVAEPAQSRGHTFERVALIAWQLAALGGQVWAVHLARQGQAGSADALSNFSMAVAFGSAVWALTRVDLTRGTRNIAVACLAVNPTLMSRATDPLLFTGFDEQLHFRTLVDILDSHRLFEGNPVLAISPFYPGLESVTVVLCQLGLPPMLAATVLIILARVVLVALLCDSVELLADSARAGGLAVAVYAVSPQFVWFNSQFSYQTLSIPLALGAISLIGRARDSATPLPFFGGATVCLLGVAMTHHLTSFLTASFLVLWTLAEHGPAKQRVAYGALCAIASTVAWAVVQRATLERYFGPMISDITSQVSGGVRRQAFKSAAGTATPIFDKILLLYYAAALSLTVLGLLILTIRWGRQRIHGLNYWNPQILVLALCAVIPVLLAARVVPKGVEIFTRSSSFLFLPLSFVLVNYLRRLDWWQLALGDRPIESRGAGPSNVRRQAAHFVAVVLMSGVFLGGYVLGSGPSWARLPGPYMPSADSRSMDSETLAAVKWAGESLPRGSRIGADRVSAVLLAAQADLWPVYEGLNGVKTPDVYVPFQWGLEETDLADALKIRYLYVDRRMADSLPPFGIYFADGEANEGQQFTLDQLTKFDRVGGIKAIYRHGPVSIYDIKGLGLTEYRSGWLGPTPVSTPVSQVAIGLTVGLFLTWVMRGRFWPRICAQAMRLRSAFGPACGAAVLLAGVGLVSAALLLVHVWLTPLIIASAVSVPLMVFPGRVAARLRYATGHLTRLGLTVTAALVIPLGAIIGFSIYDAATADIIQVRQILDDPESVHIVPEQSGS